MTVVLLVGIGAVFAGIFLSLTAVGVFTNEAKGVSKTLAVIEGFSTAPQSMKDELDRGFQDRRLNPFLHRLTGLGSGWTPSSYTERVVVDVNFAVIPPGWTVDPALSLNVVG